MISREEVLKLAELARLKVADAEVAVLQKDISNILEYVGQISAVQPQGENQGSNQGSTLAQGSQGRTFPRSNLLREDIPRADGDIMSGKEEALRSAFPKKENGYNIVRKIIQKDE